MTDRCHVCDREECDIAGASQTALAAYRVWIFTQRKSAGNAWSAARNAEFQMREICRANAVNWRERALAAEAGLAAVVANNATTQAKADRP